MKHLIFTLVTSATLLAESHYREEVHASDEMFNNSTMYNTRGGKAYRCIDGRLLRSIHKYGSGRISANSFVPTGNNCKTTRHSDVFRRHSGYIVIYSKKRNY